jgi:hypothetical protein
MRKIILVFVLMLTVVSYSQNKQLLYNHFDPVEAAQNAQRHRYLSVTVGDES